MLKARLTITSGLECAIPTAANGVSQLAHSLVQQEGAGGSCLLLCPQSFPSPPMSVLEKQYNEHHCNRRQEAVNSKPKCCTEPLKHSNLVCAVLASMEEETPV
eukprot:455965-Amphidinium_carterae.1